MDSEIGLESFIDEPVIVAGLGDPAPHTALLQHLRTAFSRRLEFDAVASASDQPYWSFFSS